MYTFLDTVLYNFDVLAQKSARKESLLRNRWQLPVIHVRRVLRGWTIRTRRTNTIFLSRALPSTSITPAVSRHAWSLFFASTTILTKSFCAMRFTRAYTAPKNRPRSKRFASTGTTSDIWDWERPVFAPFRWRNCAQKSWTASLSWDPASEPSSILRQGTKCKKAISGNFSKTLHL